jgi:preprotein translocase subunit SecA
MNQSSKKRILYRPIWASSQIGSANKLAELPVNAGLSQRGNERRVHYKKANDGFGFFETGVIKKTTVTEFPNASQPELTSKAKVGRNDPCPCGSGKKYKKCCIGKKGI